MLILYGKPLKKWRERPQLEPLRHKGNDAKIKLQETETAYLPTERMRCFGLYGISQEQIHPLQENCGNAIRMPVNIAPNIDWRE